ncbi:MAG: hypothetical protein AAB906_05095, partial [Patescibacteria group bacterium]
DKDLIFTATGIDLAISQKAFADRTAMISARVYRIDGILRIYILPYIVNERLTFPETIERIKSIKNAINNGYSVLLFIEKVAYQEAMVQQLASEGIYVIGVSISQDKRTRLALTTAMLQNAQILFSRKGAEELIQQLIGFGIERFDDLADAFSLLILEIMKQNTDKPDIIWI